MCGVQGTHSGSHTSPWWLELLDNWLKTLNWNLGWQTAYDSADDSSLPLPYFFASQLARTEPHAWGSPARSRGQGKTKGQLCCGGSNTEHVAGSNKQQESSKVNPTRRLWQSTGEGYCGFRNKLLSAWASEVTFPTLSLGMDTDLRWLPTDRRAVGQDDAWCGDKPWIPGRRASICIQVITTWPWYTTPNLLFGFVCTCEALVLLSLLLK